MTVICGQEICIKIFLEKVRILPFFLLSLRVITTESCPFAHLLPCLLPSQAPGISSSEHKCLRPLGFVGPLLGQGYRV